MKIRNIVLMLFILLTSDNKKSNSFINFVSDLQYYKLILNPNDALIEKFYNPSYYDQMPDTTIKYCDGYKCETIGRIIGGIYQRHI